MQGVILELLQVALFDLMHEVVALKEVGAHVTTDFVWDNCELIMRSQAEGYGAACGNQVYAPLVNETQIPEYETREDSGASC